MQNNIVITKSERTNLRRQQKDALRQSILEAASKLVAQGGPEMLSLRKVAEEVGASTMVVYTVFGNKEGLLEAIWQESFRRLWEMEEAAMKIEDPLLRLKLLGQAYRKNALNNPSFYKLVFQGQAPIARANQHNEQDKKATQNQETKTTAAKAELPASTTTTTEHSESTSTFTVLIETIAACQTTGKLSPKHSACDLAAMFWSTAHGVISLELSGMLSLWADPQNIFELNFEYLIAGLK
jgi:AcrR family transcriptional regulator